MNIVVTGTLGFDYIMDFSGRFAERIMPDKIHKISLSFLVEKLNKQFGGTAGNIAYTLKLLGLNPLIASAAGNDFAPYEAFLKKNKISTEGILKIKDESTGAYFVVTDRDDNQIGSFYLGATKYAKDVPLNDYIGYKSFVVIAPTDPVAMMSYVKTCIDVGVPYMFDPAFQIAQFSKKDLRLGIEHAAVFIANDYEVSLVEESLEISHEDLRVMVPVVVTTIGSRGSIIETRSDSMHVKPAKLKRLVDPTGAGDAYRSGFLSGFLRKLPLEICGQMGSVAAAYTVEKYGTITHSFTQKEFINRYEDNYHSHIEL
jgi:adenosine kinase